jgi:hypothetical protein
MFEHGADGGLPSPPRARDRQRVSAHRLRIKNKIPRAMWRTVTMECNIQRNRFSMNRRRILADQKGKTDVYPNQQAQRHEFLPTIFPPVFAVSFAWAK